ncbi:hypothetical protein KAU33_03260 [Candidatus Dependentiae bacterium]|nr:hypothetical protein [Candidatus Dependentiae bacterium]
MKEKVDKFSKVFSMIAVVFAFLMIFVRYNLIFSFCKHKTLIEKGFIALTVFSFSMTSIKNENRYFKLTSRILLLFSIFFIHSIILDLIKITNNLILLNFLLFLSFAIFFEYLFYFNNYIRKEFYKKFDVLSFSIIIPLYFIYTMLINTIIQLINIF